MRVYYAQRAGAGLVISEGTQISAEGMGYADTPGIHSPEQLAGWKRVTDAVHAEGGLIAAQLWHTDRVNHESLPDCELPVPDSAIKYSGRTSLEAAAGNIARGNSTTPHAQSSHTTG